MTRRGLIFTPVFLGWTIFKSLSFLWMLVIPPRDFLVHLRGYSRGLDWLERHVLGLTYNVEGELPRTGPALIAMKHQSTWETMKLHLLFDNPAIVLKKELLDIPLWGRYAAMLDLIPIDRSAGREALVQMAAAANRAQAQGRPIIVFPQGTRVPVGKVEPYKAGIGRLYAATGLPIVPVALNSGLFWPKRQFAQRAGHITLRVLEPIPPGLEPREAVRILEQRLEQASNELVQNA